MLKQDKNEHNPDIRSRLLAQTWPECEFDSVSDAVDINNASELSIQSRLLNRDWNQKSEFDSVASSAEVELSIRSRLFDREWPEHEFDSISRSVDLNFADEVEIDVRSRLESITNGQSNKTSKQLKTSVESHYAKDAVLAVKDAAELCIRSGKFLCINETLYFYSEPIWRPLQNRKQEGMAIMGPTAGHLITEKQYRDVAFAMSLDRRIAKDWADIPSSKNLLAFLDGVYDLDSGEIRVAAAEDYLFTHLNVSIEEVKQGENLGYFDKFVKDVCQGDARLEDLLLEVIATILSQYRPKKLFFLYGRPHTGKSQLILLLQHILGAEAIHSIRSPNELGGKWTGGSLIGKKLCVCPDTERQAMDLKSIAMAKQITGGDPIMAEKKMQQPITIKCEAALLFAGNAPLQYIKDQGFEKRILTIPFLNPIKSGDQIPDFADCLYAERGYIIQRIIPVLRRLVEENFQYTEIEYDLKSMQEVPRIIDPMNGIEQFVDQCCSFIKEARSSSQNLYCAYETYCLEAGQEPLSQIHFARLLKRCFPELVAFKTKALRGFEGIAIKESNGVPEEVSDAID